MKVFIKHMVSLRCINAVAQELINLEIEFKTIELGVVIVVKEMTTEQKEKFQMALNKIGLEVIETKKEAIVEQIKIAIRESIFTTQEKIKTTYSDYLSKKLKHNYTYLSNHFAKYEGYTISQFIIKQRIERVKELIQYKELSFSEIAFKLNYSSIAHLSNQFKKMTGTTLSYYRMHVNKRVINIDTI